MGLYDFFTQEELDDLPHEDGPRAFSAFVKHAYSKLSMSSRQIDTSEQSGWRELEDLRHSYMNIVVAASKRYKIEPFASMSVPKMDDFGDRDYRQFASELDHYITQLVIDNSVRDSRDLVPVPEKSKEKIRNYIRNLREYVEKADITDAKRSKLLERLDEFEKELEKRRLSVTAVGRLIIAIAVVPGGLWQSAEIVAKLANNIVEVVAEAQIADEETKILPAIIEPARLSPPREENRNTRAARPATGFDTGSIDDDIPF